MKPTKQVQSVVDLTWKLQTTFFFLFLICYKKIVSKMYRLSQNKLKDKLKESGLHILKWEISRRVSVRKRVKFTPPPSK